MILYKFILFGFAVVFMIHALTSLSHARGDNQKLAMANIGMSLFSALNCLVSFAAIEFEVLGSYKHLFFDLAFFSGGVAFYFYLTSIRFYLGLASKKLLIIKKIFLILMVPFFVDAATILASGNSFLTRIKEGLSHNIYFAHVGINIEPFPLAGLNIVIINISLVVACILIWKQLDKSETWLKLGIIVTLAAAINDSLMPSPFGTYLVPLYFLSNLVEASRFSYVIRVDAYNKIGHLEGEVERLSKASEISYIAGSISHDIANPLMVIQASLLGLKKGYNEKKIEKIERASNKIKKIINTYLNLMRTDPEDQRRPANLKAITKEALESCENRIYAAETKVDLDNSLDQGILCNETKMELVFNNLISNSCDAIMGNDSSWIRISFEKSGNDGLIRVMDSGSGIASEMQDQIFQKQFTTKSYANGTGLGLDMVKQLLDEHGFSIHIDNQCPNTCFVITIPGKSLV
jgi:signal transduction histidine kinase